MVLTIDLDPPEGGIVISGSREELVDFAVTITNAAHEGEDSGLLLKPDGVEPVRIVCIAEGA